MACTDFKLAVENIVFVGIYNALVLSYTAISIIKLFYTQFFIISRCYDTIVFNK